MSSDPICRHVHVNGVELAYAEWNRPHDECPSLFFLHSRMLWDYCRFGLLPDESGGFTLACPPEVEASVYSASRSNGGIYDSARALDIPVFILRAREPPATRQAWDFASSPTYPGLVESFKRGREVYLHDCTHFVPMQMPSRVVDAIEAALAA